MRYLRRVWVKEWENIPNNDRNKRKKDSHKKVHFFFLIPKWRIFFHLHPKNIIMELSEQFFLFVLSNRSDRVAKECCCGMKKSKRRWERHASYLTHHLAIVKLERSTKQKDILRSEFAQTSFKSDPLKAVQCARL